MRSPMFAFGLDAIRSGRPFDADIDDWSYDRGRLFGAIAPFTMPLRIEDKINPKAVRLYEAAAKRGYLI